MNSLAQTGVKSAGCANSSSQRPGSPSTSAHPGWCGPENSARAHSKGVVTATDVALLEAHELVNAALSDSTRAARVTSLFDEPANTASYVVTDPATRRCAIADSVLSFEAAAGRTSTQAADAIAEHVRREQLSVQWILEMALHTPGHTPATAFLKRRRFSCNPESTVGWSA